MSHTDQIDATSVPRARTDVVAAYVGDEAVLVDLRTRGAHQVNQSAAAVFALCDGELDIRGIADELADIYRIDAAQILDQIVAAVEQFGGLGLVELGNAGADTGAAAPAPDETDVDPRHIPAPCSPCQANIDGLGWGPTIAVAVGDHVLGVRANDDAASARVRALVADRIVDDPDVPANWSVVLVDGLPDDDGPHRRSGLYEGHLWLSGDLDHDGILELLARRLARFETLRPGQVRLEVNALVGDVGAVLLPWEFRFPDQRLDELAEQHGWSVLAAPVVLTVPDGDGPVTLDGADGAAVPVRGVVSWGSDTTRLDGAEAAIVAVRLLTPSARGGVEADAVEQAIELPSRLAMVATSPDKQADVAAALVRAR